MINPKVNVIVTCYNSEKYLRDTLESVLAQNFTNFVLTVVEDGSTDNTTSILRDYKSRLTVLTHLDGGNHGQSSSLNLGVSHCNSEYIAFLDHDDTWCPNKLRRQVEVLDLCPDVGLVYTNGFVINNENRILYPLLPEEHKENNRIIDLLLDCYIRTPSMVMVRTSLLKKVGPFMEGKIADHDMWLRINEVSRSYYLNEKLTCYREHSESISFSHNIKMWLDALFVLEKAIQRYPYPAWSRRKRLAVINYRLGKAYMKNRSCWVASVHMLKSFLIDPARAIKYAIEHCVR